MPDNSTHHEAFVPTPDYVVEAKVRLAALKPDEVLYDLGCGDGRVLIHAAKEYGVRCVGIESRPECVEQARDSVRAEGLEDLVEVALGDYLEADISEADVVILYLNRGSLGPLSIKLEADLRTWARVITHQFDLPGWSEERTEKVHSGDGREETVYVYRKGGDLLTRLAPGSR